MHASGPKGIAIEARAIAHAKKSSFGKASNILTETDASCPVTVSKKCMHTGTSKCVRARLRNLAALLCVAAVSLRC